MLTVPVFRGSMHQLSSITRALHTSSMFWSKVSKESLSKLRKKTGFTFSNCKKALQKFDNDMVKAEEWLHEEAQKAGWTKATKLHGRTMSHGLIALQSEAQHTVMIEMNCETDFVARNSKFQDLVSSVTAACAQQTRQWTQPKVVLDQEEVGKLVIGDKTVADTVALAVGDIGENMRVRRLAYMNSTNNRVGYYVHSANSNPDSPTKCIMGKFGAMVSFTATDNDRVSKLSLKEVGRQLAQHVVGMNPQSIGKPSDIDAHIAASSQSKQEPEPPIVAPTESDTTGQAESEQEYIDPDLDSEPPARREKDDSRIILQDFLNDPDIYVYEFLDQNNAEIQDFVRYECGENIEES
ncbi:unnamed protein product [Owenia fusiformis]|uniref:Elongation factor Ts, mitochondrial n=1 Tax=Owenia fusiformis TaxID=6347 RepID=A0A8J1TSS9_OWEFU|nr:unnamed protein product [Owenia fusiformis]